jgi:hypothetical protein
MTGKHGSAKTVMECRKQYDRLTLGLGQVGFIWPGTLQRRMLTCGKPQCACHKDPRARHGPYYYWTSKKNGKTISRKLSREEAKILESWIENRRKADAIMKRMTKMSEKALALTLKAKSKRR